MSFCFRSWTLNHGGLLFQFSREKLLLVCKTSTHNNRVIKFRKSLFQSIRQTC